MQLSESIVEAARQRILAHRILSGPALMEYFASKVGLDESLSIEALQQEAVTRGLYRYLGERYRLALDFTIACARAAIEFDVVRSEIDLGSFLERASSSPT